MTATENPIAQLNRALAATAELIVGVRADQWDAPTPCPDWTVRKLVNHLVAGNLSIAALLREQPPPDRAADHLGSDPLGAYGAAGRDLAAAFAQPGVLDRVYETPAGPLPGIAALHLRITEQLVHGWDLAQATGQSTHALPNDLADHELRLAQAQFGGLPRGGHPFAPAQPVPDRAPALERLVGYLGRTPPTPSNTPRLTGLGARVHLFIRPEYRDAFTAMFRDTLDCELVERDFGLAHPVLLVTFPDSSAFSVELTELAPTEPPGGPLDDAAAPRGAWIEFRTTDVEHYQRRLQQDGIRQFSHPGSPHRYFSAPGGQVFRLLNLSYDGP